ncbi:MAG: hypothetical protein MI924_15335 [Chloroflexales bacterium]|nr:hypothetical protein [Chloroflexales bacterium]
MKKTLIGAYEVSYTSPQSLQFVHLIQGYIAATFTGDEVEQFRELIATGQKRITAIGDKYNVITGASNDLAVYNTASGRRMLYLDSDQVLQLCRFLHGTT